MLLHMASITCRQVTSMSAMSLGLRHSLQISIWMPFARVTAHGGVGPCSVLILEIMALIAKDLCQGHLSYQLGQGTAYKGITLPYVCYQSMSLKCWFTRSYAGSCAGRFRSSSKLHLLEGLSIQDLGQSSTSFSLVSSEFPMSAWSFLHSQFVLTLGRCSTGFLKAPRRLFHGCWFLTYTHVLSFRFNSILKRLFEQFRALLCC